ncbi:hypothetical protein B0H12DRAFT_1161137 [Mycena haematopus]|nr:hypothetical protein B0H12DRAFT_1161137 [Mycena haematopus]
MEPGPIFPQEIFDIIIDFCEDFETLRSCALVSASFHHRTRLFSRIRVGPLDEEHTIEALEQFLEDSPSSAACVKSLHLWDRDNRWMSETYSARFLSLLVSLTDIRMSGSFAFARDPVSDWVDIAPLCKSIRLALTRPNLTRLQLTRISGIPITVLAHCSALRSLTLIWVRFDLNSHRNSDDAVAACADSSPAQLEALSCTLESYTFELLVRWILCPQSALNVSWLRSLVYTTFDSLSNDMIHRLLNASAGSLQHLRLKHRRIISSTTPLDLHNLIQLQTFSPEIWLDGFRQNLLSLLSLDDVIFPSHQQALRLTLTLYTTDIRGQLVPLLTAADRALATIGFITSMTVIMLPSAYREIYDLLREDELKDVSAMFSEDMPLMLQRLAGKGTLRVLCLPDFPPTPRHPEHCPRIGSVPGSRGQWCRPTPLFP